MRRRAVVWFAAAVSLAGAARAQLPITARASVSLLEHRVTAGAGLERSSGTVFGLAARTALPWRGLEAHASLRVGSLGANAASAIDRDLGELGVGAELPLRPWLGLEGGVLIRRYESAIAAQRWAWGQIGLRGHTSLLDLLNGQLALSAGLSIMPFVSVSGISRPDLAVATHTAIAYTTGRLTASMRYGLERFDFPARNNVRRLEELSSLELGAAWKFR
jgi:hypothetical protein